MQADSEQHDISTLERLNREYIASVEASAVEWFEANLAPDFCNSNPDGSLADRAEFLAQVARPANVSRLEAHDVRIRLLGDVALIHARTSYLKASGEPGAGRYTDIWARRDGRWVCVAAHVTRA